MKIAMSEPEDNENWPVLPYGSTNPSSGYAAGVETSESFARDMDRDGRTKHQQLTTLNWLVMAGEHGATWREIDAEYGWGHGPTTRTLSNLHKEGRISRLAEKRGRSRIYVHNEFIAGRKTERQGRTCEYSYCPHHGEGSE